MLFFCGLCYSFVLNRGWSSNDDPSTNLFYYLYSKAWYRLVSVDNYWSDFRAGILNIDTAGELKGHWSGNAGGGVQSFLKDILN